MVGLLAGTLNGAAMGRAVIDFNKDTTSVTNTGQAIAVIDPSAFGELEFFKSQVDALIQDIRNSEKMPGVEKIWLPGEQSEGKRIAYSKSGIPLDSSLHQQLIEEAQRLQIEPLKIF